MGERQDNLQRQLGLRTATAVVVGEVIAVGIFLTPAGMAKSVGSPFWLLVVWLVAGAMAVAGALSYGELAARFPEAGGGYVYLREAYGEWLAFLYGWMALVVMDPGVTAALAAGLSGYVAYVFGLPPLGAKLAGVAAVLALAAANVVGVRAGAWLMRWLTWVKLGLLALVLGWGFAFRLGDWSHFTPFVAQREGSAPLLGALAGGLIAAFYSFGGWWDLSKLAGEVREPERTLPRALVYGVLVVTAVYVLTSAAFVYLVPMQAVTTGETFAAQAGEALFGRFGGVAFASVVIVAVLGSIAGLVMAAPRVYYAMARDRVFFPSAARLHPRFKTPARAIAVQAVLASALALTGSFEKIVGYFVPVVVLFLALTVAAVYVFRRRGPGRPGYLTPGYPFTPAAFLALVALLLALLAGNNPRQALLGALATAAGLPVYFVFFRGRRAALRPEGEISTR